MGIKEERIKRLFGKDGRAVYVPVDHGIMGVLQGLEDPVALLEELIRDGIDGTLVQIGLAKQTYHLFKNLPNPPARILTVDYTQTVILAGEDIDTAGSFLNATVEQALKYGCDGIKVMLPLGLSPKAELEHLRVVSQAVREADKYDMPVVIEPVAVGSRIPEDKRYDPEVIADGCRIALEMGADIIKAPYTGDKDSFALMVKRLRVPVIVLGGPKKPDIRSILQMTKEIVEAGARGPCYGRNVWGHSKVHEILHALIDIVHSGASVEDVINNYNL